MPEVLSVVAHEENRRDREDTVVAVSRHLKLDTGLKVPWTALLKRWVD
jgi:hypothetical protein